MQKIAKDVYVESSYPGVTVGAIVTEAGIICIDSPSHPADARKWRLRLMQLSDKPIQFIVNLDHHRDRVLGNQSLEAPVIAHEATFERIRVLPELFKGGLSDAGADADLAADLAGIHIVVPQLSFSERMVLAKGGREIHLVHRPGSAPGAVWVELPDEGVVFTGDAVANGVPPMLQDADLGTWLAALAELRKKKYPARVVVPGRGPVTDKDGVKGAEDFLKLVRRKLEALARGRKTRAEAAALAENLLETFHVPASLREHYTRRLRVGLERAFDALAAPAH